MRARARGCLYVLRLIKTIACADVDYHFLSNAFNAENFSTNSDIMNFDTNKALKGFDSLFPFVLFISCNKIS